jgi:cbb3-type cytochrome c oxidase subunit III
MNNFFKITIVSIFAVCAAFLSGAKATVSRQTVEFSENEISGSEIYAQNCAKCHGADGRGETEESKKHKMPDISSARWQQRHSDKKIIKAIEKGGGGMPAFGKKLSKEEIAAVVSYVRELKK